MKLLRFILLPISLFFGSPTLADPVDETLVSTFQAGQPACAADVNQNFLALIAAVNDNAARVAELEAQLRQIQRPLDAKVSGSTYTIYSYETGLGEYSSTQNVTGPGTIVKNTNGRLGHWSFVETGILTLNADGSASLDVASHEREVYVDTFATHDVDSPDLPQIARVDLSTPIDDAEALLVDGTWSISGQNLTLNIEGEVVSLVVSADGNILMAGGVGIDGTSPPILTTSMAMAVRTNPPNLAVETFEGIPVSDNGDPIQFTSFVGAEETKSIRILNLGDADLSGLSLELSGSVDFQIEQDLGSPLLGPGGQALIKIRFTEGPGPGNALLRIFSNDPDTPIYRVNLGITLP